MSLIPGSGWTLARRLHGFAAVALAALLAERGLAYAVLGAAVAFLLVIRPEALTPLRSRAFLVFTGLALAFGAWSLGPVPFRFSVGGLALGGVLVARAGTILTMARWVSLDASPFEFAALFGRQGRPFGFALGVAMNALPALEDSARRTWDALRVRGGTRRHRGRNLRRFALATLANALRRADATAEVAISRGYSMEPPTAPALPRTPPRTGIRLALALADLAAAGLLLVRVVVR